MKPCLPIWRGLALVTLAIALTAPAMSHASGEAPDDIKDAIRRAFVYTLNGDYEATYRAGEALQAKYPDHGYGHTVLLNTLVTELSWDETDDRLLDPIRDRAEVALAHCEARIDRDDSNARAWADCGVAHFAQSYAAALRGKYIAAGTSGQKSIDHLERAIEIDPDYIDARMHLGVSYYYANNLPPFVKAISRFLWFIPSPSEEKALPYINSVIEQGEEYGEVARFILADLLIKSADPADGARSVALVQDMAEAYPQNIRLHLAAITNSLLVRDNDNAETAWQRFANTGKDWSDYESGMMLTWRVRMLLDEGRREEALAAASDLADIDATLPFWMDPWIRLSEAQVHDLRGERTAAKAAYREAIKLNQRYPSSRLRAIAESGLDAPFTIEPEDPDS